MYNNTLRNNVIYSWVSKPLYNNFIYPTLDFRLIVNVTIILVGFAATIILWGPKGNKWTFWARFITNGSICLKSSQAEESQSDVEQYEVKN